MMRLWTIQGVDAYNKLLNTGKLITDETYIMKGFESAYDWMANKLRKICVPPIEAKYPVWAWYQWEGVRQKRNIHDEGLGIAGEHMVQLTLEIDDSLILLSDFDLFHYVLNNCYLPADEADDMEFNEMFFECDEHKNEYIINSWDRIFDLTKEGDGYIYGKNSEKSIQAVFWQISPKNIVDVEEFII